MELGQVQSKSLEQQDVGQDNRNVAKLSLSQFQPDRRQVQCSSVDQLSCCEDDEDEEEEEEDDEEDEDEQRDIQMDSSDYGELSELDELSAGELLHAPLLHFQHKLGHHQRGESSKLVADQCKRNNFSPKPSSKLAQFNQQQQQQVELCDLLLISNDNHINNHKQVQSNNRSGFCISSNEGSANNVSDSNFCEPANVCEQLTKTQSSAPASSWASKAVNVNQQQQQQNENMQRRMSHCSHTQLSQQAARSSPDYSLISILSSSQTQHQPPDLVQHKFEPNRSSQVGDSRKFQQQYKQSSRVDLTTNNICSSQQNDDNNIPIRLQLEHLQEPQIELTSVEVQSKVLDQNEQQQQQVTHPAMVSLSDTTTTSAKSEHISIDLVQLQDKQLEERSASAASTITPTLQSNQSNGSSGYQSPSMFNPHQQQQPHHKQAEQHQQQQQPQRHYPPNHPLANTKHLCSICGDRATGKHYGVFSCEGCKGFFKRTIRKDIVYVCRADGHCLIDMRQRNRCQFCRYQKCLSQGMKREAVQEEKQRLKLRATQMAQQANNINNIYCDSQLENTTSNLMIEQQQQQQQQQTLRNLNYQDQQQQQQIYNQEQLCNQPAQKQTANWQLQLQEMQLARLAQPQLDQQQLNVDLSSPSDTLPSPTSNYLNVIDHHKQQHHQQQLCSDNRLAVMRDYANYYNSTTDQQLLQDSYQEPARKYSRMDDLSLRWAAQAQIEQLLEWAKSVPRFTELLIDDQITLLKAYWNELIISDIAFKSVEALKENLRQPMGSLCIGRGLYINQTQARDVGLSAMFERILNELVSKMHQMRVDATEIACLRAIILFNPETHGLKTSQPIEEYRGDVYSALEMYCRKSYEDQPNRFGKLLLRLPALRSIGLKCDSMRSDNNCNNNPNHLTHSMSSSNELIANTNQISSSMSPNVANNNNNSNVIMHGYQVKLLFFDICYESSAIDVFLRSALAN